MLSTTRFSTAINAVVPPAIASRCRPSLGRAVTLGGLPELCRYLASCVEAGSNPSRYSTIPTERVRPQGPAS